MTKSDPSRQELQESEERYKKLINSLPHGLSIVQHNEIVFVNKAALEMFGYDDYEELVGKKGTFPLFREEKEDIYEKCLKLLNDEIQGPLHYKTLAVRKDGTVFEVETYVSKIIYKGWRALQVVNMDISDKVEAEKNYQRILDSIADPLNVINEDLELVYANEPLKDWIENLGLNEDFIGKKINKVFPFLKDKTIDEYKKVFNNGETLVSNEFVEIEDRTFYTETRKIPIVEHNEVSQVLTIIRDFTERRQYEEKLKASEEKYRHLFENSPYFILLIDETLKIIDCNKKTEEIIGYPKEDLIGKSLLEIPFLSPEKEGIFKKRAQKILNGVSLDPRELRIRKKSGELIWIKSKPSLMTMRGKKYIHLIGQDITKSKKRKRKLKINQFAIDHTSIEVFWINQKGEFEYVNKAACENLGYTYEELTDMSVPDIDPVHNLQKYNETWDQMKKKGTYTFETKHKSQNGRIYPVRVSINYLNYKGKELSIAFAIDLTEQKKTKENLKASEEKYRLLFRNSPYSIFLINMEGKIVDCNPATVDLFGFSKEEIIGSSHRELAIHPEKNVNTFIKRFVKLIKGESVEPIETQLYTKNKELIWVHIRSSLIKIDKDIYIQTIIQNIDKRKRAESELKKLNKIKSELLKRTSHELKTPLVSIKGFTNLLTEFYSQEFNEDIMSYIGEIKNACNRLEDLIKDILQTSKLKSGDKVIQKSEINLTKLIKDTVDQLKGFIKLRKHQIKMDLEQDINVKCEKEKIADLISNLLSNAIKYTPPKGLIKISSKLEDDYVVISIQDSGIGLNESEKESIFTQFGKIERYGQGFDVISEGSGLGLYISKKIIELHNGRIWVESDGRNKGSTFYFSLPRME